MILTTTERVEGKTITDYIWLVSATYPFSIQGTDKMMCKRIKEVNKYLQERLSTEAEEIGADAVVGITYSPLESGIHIVLGTAVKLS